MPALNELVTSVRQSIEKHGAKDGSPRFKVFFASGLNLNDVKTALSNLNDTERNFVLELYNVSFGEAVKDLQAANQNKLLALFCTLYETSSNTSHIANAYSGEGSEHGITAILHDRILAENDLKIQVLSSNNNEINVKVEVPDNVRKETNVISRGTYWAKNRKDGLYGLRDLSPSFSPVEYVTILTVVGKKAQVLVRNHPILANSSWILSQSGQLIRQKLGEHNKFLDEQGFDHRD